MIFHRKAETAIFQKLYTSSLMLSQEFSESFQNNSFHSTSGEVFVIDKIDRLKGGNILLQTTSSFYSTTLNKIF